MTSKVYETNRSIMNDRFKTFTAFEDNHSQYIPDESHHNNNGNFSTNFRSINNIEEQKIFKWKSKTEKIMKKYQMFDQEDSSKPNNSFLIRIEDIYDIQYRRSHIHDQKGKRHSKIQKNVFTQNIGGGNSKVYMEIVANLIIYRKNSNQNKSNRTIQFQTYSKRSLNLGIFEMEQISKKFQLQEQILIYFHTKQFGQSKLQVELNFKIIESITVDAIQTTLSYNFFGISYINPKAGIKSQQCAITSEKQEDNTKGKIIYSILMSDEYKPLECLVPPNCLCSSLDIISGLSGRQIPNKFNNLKLNIAYTELFGLKLDLLGLSLPYSYIRHVCKQAQQGVSTCFAGEFMYKNQKSINQSQKVLTRAKQVVLLLTFHNGWTAVNTTQIKLKQKIKIENKTTQKSKKQNENITIRNYYSEQIGTLPFIFIDEEAVLILQIIVKVEVKLKKEHQVEETHLLDIPLCHSYYFPDPRILDKKQHQIMYKGGYLNRNKRNFQKLQSLQELELDQSKIQFYCHLDGLNKVQQGNASVKGAGRISIMLNKSQAEFDKITLEKDRMLRQNKKLKQENRSMKIELNQQIPLLDTTGLKQQLYHEELQKIREQRENMEDILSYLEKQVFDLEDKNIQEVYQQEINLQKQHDHIRGTEERGIRNLKNYHNSQFYQSAHKEKIIENSESKINQKAIRLPYVLEDAKIGNNLSVGEVPLEIIKTQLLQQNYAYKFLINWQSLIHIKKQKLFPTKFFFSFNFYKYRYRSSVYHIVNNATGQILPFKKELEKNQVKENEKQLQQIKSITELEIGPNSFIHNDSNNFLQFISYLYHSSIQVKMINYDSGQQFGESYLKLRDLIRMGRNEVNIQKDLFIGQREQSKGKLKIEIICQKKQASTSMIPPQSQLIQTKIPLNKSNEARQLQRIARYKKQNKIVNNQITLNKIDKFLNQKFTKKQIYLHVSRMKAQIVRLEVINKNSHTQTYTVHISDQEKHFLAHQELVVIDKIFYTKLRQTRWWKYVSTLYPNTNEDIVIANQNGFIKLEPKQRGVLLFYFYTERNFYDPQRTRQIFKKHEQLAYSYTGKRCIDITLSNGQTSELVQLHKLYIIPEHDYLSYSYEYSRKANDKVVIEIDLPNSNQINTSNLNQNYVIFVDDPNVIINYDEKLKKAQLQSCMGNINECKNLQISLLRPLPENKLLVNYQIKLWGSRQICLDSQIGHSVDFLMQFENKLSQQRGFDQIAVFSDDSNNLVIRQQNPIKLNKKQQRTIIRANITSKCFGVKNYTIIVKPFSLSENIINDEILYRYSLKIKTPNPDIKQKIIVRIKLTDTILEEPFIFLNQLTKNLKLQVVSTNQQILWTNSKTIEVESKKSKKMMIKINGQIVNKTTQLILSFISDKYSQHYLFVLERDNIF